MTEWIEWRITWRICFTKYMENMLHKVSISKNLLIGAHERDNS